jgi:hypothetical protein
MLKKSFNYLIIATANLVLLTGFLILWTDKLEMTFNGWVLPWEFLKILVFTLASLIAMRILVGYFRRRNISAIKAKIKVATLLTFLISSYLYIDYAIKAYNNIITNGEFRSQLADKIKPANRLANGTKAENLTIKEYEQLEKTAGFPKIPGESSNIKYAYEYDGFLPDYLFTVEYDLPLHIEVDTINYSSRDFTRSRSFEIVNNKKRVTYEEGVH